MRVQSSEKNELKIWDNISNSEVAVYYKMPTTAERAAYSNEAIQRVRNKIILRSVQARQKFGLKILTGIREGDFGYDKGGKTVALSSDPQNAKLYREDWKDMMMKIAPDIVELLAATVFDAPAEALDETADTDNLSADGEGEGPVPQ